MNCVPFVAAVTDGRRLNKNVSGPAEGGASGIPPAVRGSEARSENNRHKGRIT
jgi:hypothetical protein